MTLTNQNNNSQDIIIYNTADGKAKVSLYAKDGSVWCSQKQLAELFATSVPNINIHIRNILRRRKFYKELVVKYYLITAADGKEYNVTFYSLDVILAVGLRVRGVRGAQFREWANSSLKDMELIRPKQ